MEQNFSIKDASDLMGIQYENAKAIFRVYRFERRKTKQKRHTSHSSFPYLHAQLPSTFLDQLLTGE